jgi:hypothetical protein
LFKKPVIEADAINIRVKVEEGGWRRRKCRSESLILGALAAVDMDHHALTIDIGDFEMEPFVKALAAGIDGGKVGVVVEGFDMGQKASDFIDA